MMMEIKSISSAVVEFFSVMILSISVVLFGTWIPAMTVLMVLNLTDIATGFLKSGKRYLIDSKKFCAGVKRKVGLWILIIVANSIDVMAFGNMPVAKTGVVGVLVGYEGISITENLAEIGVPIPSSITKYLAQIKQEKEDYLEEKMIEKNEIDKHNY